MKAVIITLFTFSFAFTSNAQEVVSTQGNSYSNGTVSIDYTIGEVVINTGTSGTNDLTQGFHQTNWNFLGVENHALSYEVLVFPNPTSEVLNIQASTFENVTYALYDATGRLVLEDKLTAERTAIQVSHLAPGSYSLVLQSQTQNLKVFKLIKQK